MLYIMAIMGLILFFILISIISGIFVTHEQLQLLTSIQLKEELNKELIRSKRRDAIKHLYEINPNCNLKFLCNKYIDETSLLVTLSFENSYADYRINKWLFDKLFVVHRDANKTYATINKDCELRFFIKSSYIGYTYEQELKQRLTLEINNDKDVDIRYRGDGFENIDVAVFESMFKKVDDPSEASTDEQKPEEIPTMNSVETSILEERNNVISLTKLINGKE